MPTLVLGSTSTYDGASKTAAELATVLTGATESGGNLVLGLNGKVSFDNSSEVVGDAGVTKNLANELVVSTNTQELVVGSSIFPRVGVFKNDVTINAGVYVWSDSTGTPALDIQTEGVTVNNSGYIIGKGGRGGHRGSGSAGGAGLRVNATGVSVTNASGAYIAGGGAGGAGRVDGGDKGRNAGGGGGAGGGDGGRGDSRLATDPTAFPDGGAIGQTGTDGYTSNTPDGWQNGGQALGGGAGGAGGTADTSGSGNGAGSGAGGGRILPGVGGGVTFTGSQTGGSAGNAGGTNGPSGGGGGWGAAGGNSNDSTGGSGGAAIDDTGNTYTLTNNGTIYGAT